MVWGLGLGVREFGVCGLGFVVWGLWFGVCGVGGDPEAYAARRGVAALDAPSAAVNKPAIAGRHARGGNT